MMEDDKKKKRNKKKKNKQNNKVAEDTAVASNGEGGAASVDPQNHLDNGQNHHSRAVGAATNNDEVKVDTQQSNGAEPLNSNSAEMEKQQRLQIEASLKETIRHLRSEHDLHLQKEADLKIRLAQLQSEKESWLQKEAHLEGKVSLLSDDKASLELKQKSLDKKIMQLERDCNSWILKEKSNKEMVSNMEMELAKLQLQVEGLEESENVSMQENQRLTDIISGLQAQIRSLESSNISMAHALDEQRKHSSEYDVLNSQLEGACALVEKLMTENAELVEKVKELYLKLDRRRETPRHTSPIRYDSTLRRDGSTGVADRHSISSKNLILLAEKTEAPSEIVITQDEPSPSDKGDANSSIVMSNSLRSDESGEIVQIPLNETEAQTSELQSGGAEYESMAAVPLSDAPLIGAPFRFISFVAGYVSGADLVDKNSTSSK